MWSFEDGITNGADWYPINGGMQDFNYIFTNDFEVTIELSCCKYPKKKYLNKEWERNKKSLLEYMKQVMVICGWRQSSGDTMSGSQRSKGPGLHHTRRGQ